MITPDERIVIVVGAGCSVEFGLPTGISIMSSLRGERLDTGRTFGLGADGILTEPFLSASGNFSSIVYPDANPIIDFLKSAKSSFADSIDLFAYNHESHAALCKIYSAWKLIAAAYDKRQTIDKYGHSYTTISLRQNWKLPSINNKPNWISALARKYTENKQDSSQLEPNALTIITFNYDTIAEDALKHFFQKTERFSDITDDLVPQVHHVYGKFPSIPDQLGPVGLIDECASSIHYINDTPRPSPDMAREAIKLATTIYIVGFDMEPKNVELIGLDNTSARLCALNYDGNFRLRSRFKSIGVEDDLLISGSDASPMSIGEACRQGFFDLASY